VAPNQQPTNGYPPCVKTAALNALFANAQWDGAFTHYCLKGSQVDFIDSTGLAVRLGNSIAESGFVEQASCMTCHGRALFDQKGQPTTGAGFDKKTGAAPLGSIPPSWVWTFAGQPPIFEGMPGLTRIATPVDFVWSIPFCAVDDTVTPPKLNQRCVGK
jgi:hypothetical protein